MKKYKSYSYVKKYFLLCSLMCLLFVCTANVSAASYPLLVANKYMTTCKAGEKVDVVYTYWPEFKNERIDSEIRDSSGTVIATASRSFYNYTNASKTYTITWDTTDEAPGKYTVVSYKYFYSLYRWNVAPTTTTCYITIECEHNWDNGTITTNPTIFKEGEKTYKCKTCGETKTEKVPVKSTETVKASNGYFSLSKNAVSGTVEAIFTKPANKNKTSIVIPNTITVDGTVCKVTSIADGAFKNNKKIKKIVIGSNVTSIGANAFSGCTNLNNLTIGNKVTSIGTKAFYKCTSLKKVVIPAAVSQIGKQAFYGCKNLKTLTIKTTTLNSTSVGSKAFSGINKKATIKVPKKNLSAYKKLLKSKGVSSSAKIKK